METPLPAHIAALIVQDPYNYGEAAAIVFLTGKGLRFDRRWYSWTRPLNLTRLDPLDNDTMDVLDFVIREHDHTYHSRPPLLLRLKQRIARNVPTCTLWRINEASLYAEFRLWPRWKISQRDVQQALSDYGHR